VKQHDSWPPIRRGIATSGPTVAMDTVSDQQLVTLGKEARAAPSSCLIHLFWCDLLETLYSKSFKSCRLRAREFVNVRKIIIVCLNR
jgi:hypothetical protein